jgi:pimeloyl-ACP methyl ester carboxylesterase
LFFAYVGGVTLRCTIEADIYDTAWLPATVVRDNIHTVTCPVTFCRGAVDPTSMDIDMVAALDNLSSWCPTAKLHTFPDMTHMGPLSHPSVLARVLFGSFLAQERSTDDQTVPDVLLQPLASRL